MKSLISLLFIVTSFAASAQKKQNVYFFKNDGRRVKVKDSADFIRIVQEPDSGSTLYNVLEFYPKGQKKMLAKSSKIDPVLNLEGTCITYFNNGQRKSIVNYKDNHELGTEYSFYPNGKLYTVKEYPEFNTRTNDITYYRNEKLIACNDSMGNALAADGNGRFRIYSNNFKSVNEEGDIRNGKRTGDWNGTDEDGKLKYTEKYDDGKLISGTAQDENGTYTYTQRMIAPRYKNGVSSFYEYLGKNIVYPVADRANYIQGTVVLSFVVNKNGTISDIKVVRSVSENIDEEAVRVLKASKGWLPGVYYGRQVRAMFTVPITFALKG